MFVKVFKSGPVKSRFVKLFLVAAIISASAPSTEILAISPFSKSNKKVEASFARKALGGLFAVSIVAACVIGIYKLFFSDNANKSANNTVYPGVLPVAKSATNPVGLVAYIENVNKEKISITIVVGDITKQAFKDPANSAIVNAANRALVGGSGITGAIWDASGGLTDLCKNELRDPKNDNKVDGKSLKAGQAVITVAGKLKDNKVVDWVIHTPGPDCRDENQNNDRKNLLESSYTNCLMVADENGIEVIAFPSISTGIYGYPANEANEVAISTVINYLKNNKETTRIREVRFVAFNKKTFNAYFQELQKQGKLHGENDLLFE